MQATSTPIDARRYAKTHRSLEARSAGTSTATSSAAASSTSHQKFLPDGLSLIDELDFLSADQRRFLGQVQGRTYANMFGLVERFIGAKMLEVSRDHGSATRPRSRRSSASPTRS